MIDFPLLAVIIIHYGNVELTLDCVGSLSRGTVVPIIIVVSNSSQDETTFLERQFCNNQLVIKEPEILNSFNLASSTESSSGTIILLQQPHNRGYAAACNSGIGLALTNPRIQYVWLLNNDTTVAEDATEQLLAGLKAHPQSIIGTSNFQAKHPQQLEMALGCRFYPFTTRCQPCFPGAHPQDVPDAPKVDYISGASFAFPSELISKVGMLDETFLLYYEEHDLCLRAKQMGYTFQWCREAKIWHIGGASTDSSEVNTTERRQFSHYHENFSTFCFLLKHYPYALPSALFVRSMTKMILLPLRGQANLLRSYLEALSDFLRLLMKKTLKFVRSG